MASIHITEIQRLLAGRGEPDALPHSQDGYFLEIRFDQDETTLEPPDPELKDKVITAGSPFGTATIQFDQSGQLRSIDLS